MLGNFSSFCCHLLTIFKTNFLQNILSVSNGLDPDQDWHSLSPDLGPNCLLKLTKVTPSKERLKYQTLLQQTASFVITFFFFEKIMLDISCESTLSI